MEPLSHIEVVTSERKYLLSLIAGLVIFKMKKISLCETVELSPKRDQMLTTALYESRLSHNH